MDAQLQMILEMLRSQAAKQDDMAARLDAQEARNDNEVKIWRRAVDIESQHSFQEAEAERPQHSFQEAGAERPQHSFQEAEGGRLRDLLPGLEGRPQHPLQGAEDRSWHPFQGAKDSVPTEVQRMMQMHQEQMTAMLKVVQTATTQKTSGHSSIADVKNLMKATPFNNREDDFDEWRRKTSNYIAAVTRLKKVAKEVLAACADSKDGHQATKLSRICSQT